jgi:hypothetical protein
MTFTHLSEVIRKRLGWCPDSSMTPAGKRILPNDTVTSTRPVDDVVVKNHVIVDYGSTGTLLSFFIRFGAGVIGIVVILALIRMAYPLLAAIVLCGFVISVALIIFYQDIKRAYLLSTPDSLIIHKVLPWSVVIPKDTIATVEVRDNIQSVPLWLLTVLVVIVIPVTSAVVLFGEYLQFAPGEITSLLFLMNLGFDISIILFSLAIYYHARIRSDYPKTLIISTTTRKKIGVYVENMDEIGGMLGRSL